MDHLCDHLCDHLWDHLFGPHGVGHLSGSEQEGHADPSLSPERWESEIRTLRLSDETVRLRPFATEDLYKTEDERQAARRRAGVTEKIPEKILENLKMTISFYLNWELS